VRNRIESETYEPPSSERCLDEAGDLVTGETISWSAAAGEVALITRLAADQFLYAREMTASHDVEYLITEAVTKSS
jgi:hypothetical protein